MKELSTSEVSDVSGGMNLFNLGAAVSACVLGFIFGGPVGLGSALCGIAMATGVNGMVDLSTDCLGTNPNEQPPR